MSDAEFDDEDNGDPLTRDFSVNLLMVIAMVVAFAFLGAAIGRYVTVASRPKPSTVDVGFYRDMTYHHQQAVQMATLEVANGTDPSVKSFASEIMRQQSYELGLMFDTLDHYGYSADAGTTAMGWMGPAIPIESMPGLATKQQIQALTDARGAGSDRLFLELMTAHHRGGIHMATYAYRHGSLKSVRELAQRMAWDQAVDINEFRNVAAIAHIPVVIDKQATTVPDPYS